jgi:hypothetical protein
MATEPELRAEIAEERRELTSAVSDLRGQLEHTAERGKQISVRVGAVLGAVVAVRTALKVRRSFRDD